MLRYFALLSLLLGCAGQGATLTPIGEKASAGHAAVNANEQEYFARKRLEAMERMLNGLRDKSEMEKLKGVNDFFNRVRFVSDIQNWGVEDYWARPSEFLARDQGDCEDYVIAKYFALKRLGVPEKKLFFTYVKAVKFNQAHMVLTYYEDPKAVPLVLDNLNYRIFPATKRKDLVYVYSFNAESLFLNTQQGRGKTLSGGKSRNKAWAAFLQRIEKEGL
ncbi:transglutaminase-like cysteine peptidase [Sulfurimonas diazotrophicus]|uniref:Transglutaminase-like cysteine peptidase n=1 Tax=Sulfurimonas diazotrophicus TaxID=3131939 RepID=A0ABZ3H896_9BACT